MNFTNTYANFLNQFEKTDLRRFSDPTKQFVLDILDFSRENPDGDNIFAAGKTRLAESCAKFIAARRINQKPVSFRELVLIDAAHAMIDAIKQTIDANCAAPAKYKSVVDGCHMLARMTLPGWPIPGTFLEIEKLGMQIDHLPTKFVSRLTDDQFFKYDHVRQTTWVLLSDAAGKDSLDNWVAACQAAYQIKFDGAEAFTSRVFDMESKKFAIGKMQTVAASPIGEDLKQFIEFYLNGSGGKQKTDAARKKIADVVAIGDQAFKIADYQEPTPMVTTNRTAIIEYLKGRGRGRGAA